jgi:hypothetical protein
MIKLGWTYRDNVTGFKGVAIGEVSYLTGCNQVLLAPPVGDHGDHREARWFDVQWVVGPDRCDKINHEETPPARCEVCDGTGFYGDNGPGVRGNREYQPCDQCRGGRNARL